MPYKHKARILRYDAEACGPCFVCLAYNPPQEEITPVFSDFPPANSFANLYQILSREPNKHCNFDTMCIRVAVLFLALFRII